MRHNTPAPEPRARDPPPLRRAHSPAPVPGAPYGQGMSSTTPEAQPPADAPRTEAPKVAPQALMGLLLRDTALLLAGCAALLYFCGAQARSGWLIFWGAKSLASAPPFEQVLCDGALPLISVAIACIMFHSTIRVATARKSRLCIAGASAAGLLAFFVLDVSTFLTPVLVLAPMLLAALAMELNELVLRAIPAHGLRTTPVFPAIMSGLRRFGQAWAFSLFVLTAALLIPFFMGRENARLTWQGGSHWQLTTADGQQRIVVIIDSTPEQLIVALVSGSQRPTTLEVIRDDSLRHLKLTRLP